MRSPVGDENGLTLIGSSGIADLRNEIPGRGREPAEVVGSNPIWDLRNEIPGRGREH